MKSLLRWRVLLPSVVVMAIATSVTLAVTIFAAAPPLPYEFFGTVKIDGQVPPDGTLVEALVSGVTPNAGSTTTFNGGPGLEGVYILPAKGDDPETSGVKEGGVQGDSISFRITPPGGSPLTANETATYGAAGGSETLNLTATSTGPTQHTLTVIKSGTGTGLVSSDNPHINCGTACTADYTQGTVVTLQATADQGSTFDGWSGGGAVAGRAPARSP